MEIDWFRLGHGFDRIGRMIEESTLCNCGVVADHGVGSGYLHPMPRCAWAMRNEDERDAREQVRQGRRAA